MLDSISSLAMFGFMLLFAIASIAKGNKLLELAGEQEIGSGLQRLYHTAGIFMLEPLLSIPLALVSFCLVMTTYGSAEVGAIFLLPVPWGLGALVVWPLVMALRTRGGIRRRLLALGGMGLVRGAMYWMLIIASGLPLLQGWGLLMSPLLALLSTGVVISFVGHLMSWSFVSTLADLRFAGPDILDRVGPIGLEYRGTVPGASRPSSAQEKE